MSLLSTPRAFSLKRREGKGEVTYSSPATRYKTRRGGLGRAAKAKGVSFWLGDALAGVGFSSQLVNYKDGFRMAIPMSLCRRELFGVELR